MVRKSFVVALLVLALPMSAMAATYTWTDMSSGVPGSAYDLTVTSLGGTSYNALFTVQTVDVNSATWYIDWFQIKLDGGTPATITGINAPISGWSIMNGGAGIDLARFGNETFATSTWSGLYQTLAVDGASLSDLALGVKLDGDSFTWDFDFTLDGAFNASPSLQVGYYDGFSGHSSNLRTARMSQPTSQVPEPDTLLLLGGGLIGLAALRRSVRE